MGEIILTSIIAGLATCIGCFVVLLLGNPREKTISVLFGLAAGIMLAVVMLDLLPSAFEQGSLRQVITGFSLGIIIMLILDLVLSQVFSPLRRNSDHSATFLRMGYLIIIGIALHDLPEGIAIAAGYSAEKHLGVVIALAIGLHNIPEGMATATPLKIGGISPVKIFFLNLLVSMFTPLGAAIGLILVNISPHYIAVLLSIAAGAMTFIVRNELLPQSRKLHPNYSTLAGILGFLFILGLTFIY